ncbi:MAG: hypothetical protein AAGU23_02635 [Bacillota bacterium]
MKAFLQIEAIADDTSSRLKVYEMVVDTITCPGFCKKIIFGGPDPFKPWVAEITGLDPVYKFKREFLKAKKDYTHSNGTGSRGIYVNYIIECGRIYEVKCMATSTRIDRYFCMAEENGDIKRLTREEVEQCLKTRSGLTCSQRQGSV